MTVTEKYQMYNSLQNEFKAFTQTYTGSVQNLEQYVSLFRDFMFYKLVSFQIQINDQQKKIDTLERNLLKQMGSYDPNIRMM